MPSIDYRGLALALTVGAALGLAHATTANANPTGRFYVLACSVDAATPGATKKAGRTVVALRDAGFERAHLIASEHLPKLKKGFVVCVVDSSSDQKAAYGVSAKARDKGFDNYIARGW